MDSLVKPKKIVDNFGIHLPKRTKTNNASLHSCSAPTGLALLQRPEHRFIENVVYFGTWPFLRRSRVFNSFRGKHWSETGLNGRADISIKLPTLFWPEAAGCLIPQLIKYCDCTSPDKTLWPWFINLSCWFIYWMHWLFIHNKHQTETRKAKEEQHDNDIYHSHGLNNFFHIKWKIKMGMFIHRNSGMNLK